MKIALLACYELGHQPLSLAWPLAALGDAGFRAEGFDLSIDAFPIEKIEQSNLVAIAVPMHTALRLGVQAATRVRVANPRAHVCFYGLYAWLNAEYLLGRTNPMRRPPADTVIGGEYEEPLTALAMALRTGEDLEKIVGVSTAEADADPYLARVKLPVPQRQGLPAISNYAGFEHNGRRRLAGYVEASRGCLHKCLHCPVVPIYDGRFFAVPAETVLADVHQQVAAGAQHITFGDPDFLNGPGHAIRIARAIHQAYPELSFDFTTKVEHILEKRDLLPELKELGAAFVVSAFESTSDEVLRRLEKGHTVAELDGALEILSDANLPVQPTWVPFTPWTTMDDYLEFLAWVRDRNLIQHLAPVQYSIRLLVPPQSALLSRMETKKWLGELDPVNFTYGWIHPDPCVDELQREIAAIAEFSFADFHEAYAAIEELAYRLAGLPIPRQLYPPVYSPAPPRLTEDWFC